MHEIEIAGQKIYYRNVADLNLKVVSLLKGAQRRRIAAESSFETFKKQEEHLRKFLGGCSPAVESEPVSEKASDEN